MFVCLNDRTKMLRQLYKRKIALICVMWYYLFVLICTCDVASCGASDCAIYSRSSIVTEVKGYVAHCGLSANHFKMI